MKVVESGHIYELEQYDDIPGVPGQPLVFVNRKCDNPFHECGVRHPGTQTQEVLRALIDRAKHLEECLGWVGNDKIIFHLQMALAYYEARALIRKVEKRQIQLENYPTGADGHIILERGSNARRG